MFFTRCILTALLLSLSGMTSLTAQAFTITIEAPTASELLDKLEELADQFRLRHRPPDAPTPPTSAEIECSGAGACGFLVSAGGGIQNYTITGLASSTTYRVHPQNTCSVGDTDIPGFPYGFPVEYTTDGSGEIAVPVTAFDDCIVIVGENIVPVAGGSNLQTAINNAIAGDTLLLAEGATWNGEFHLRVGKTSWVNIRGEGTGATLTGNNNPGVIRTDASAKYWYLENIDVRGLASGTGIELGTSGNEQDSYDKVPGWFVLDNMRVRGHETNGGRTGLSLHTSHTKIINSEFTDFKGTQHTEAKAMYGGNGPGPYFIADNLIQGAGINILFGGLDPPIIGLVPENIIITRNTISKPIEWHSLGYNVKNLFELKNARYVTITYNDFDGCWANPGNSNNGQCATWLKSVDQGVGGIYDCTLCEVRAVYFGYNKFTRIAGGPQITSTGGEGSHPIPMTDVTFEHNLFEIDSSMYTDGYSQSGAGRFIMTFQGTHGVRFINNTIIHYTPGNAFAIIEGNQSWCSADGCPNNGFVWQNNIFMMNGSPGGNFGWHPGKGSQFNTQFPGHVWNGNLYELTGSGSYPSGNFVLAAGELVTVAKYNSTTKLLDSDSPYKGVGIGGVDPGWDGTGGRPQP